MDRKLVIRFDGFEYIGGHAVPADGELDIDSPALAELIVKRGALPAITAAQSPAPISLDDFELDAGGRVLLRNPALLRALSVDAQANSAPPASSNTNDYCSSMTNGSCNILNTACS